MGLRDLIDWLGVKDMMTRAFMNCNWKSAGVWPALYPVLSVVMLLAITAQYQLLVGNTNHLAGTELSKEQPIAQVKIKFESLLSTELKAGKPALPPLYKLVLSKNGRVFEVDKTLVAGLQSSPKVEDFSKAQQCLAQAMYFEARNEPIEGWQAVGDVVINRVRDKRYPAQICDVVFQGEWRRHRCQFSFACDGRSDRAYNKVFWERAHDMAGKLLTEGSNSVIAGIATHYHADYVAPRWSNHMRPITKIGRHIFYAEEVNRRKPLPLKRPEKDL